MSDIESDDFPERGIHSPDWMVHAVLEVIPERALRVALRKTWASVLLDEDDMLDPVDVIDMVVQFALTGEFIHPELGSFVNPTRLGGDPHAESNDEITEEDIQRFIEDLTGYPTREDEERNTRGEDE